MHIGHGNVNLHDSDVHVYSVLWFMNITLRYSSNIVDIFSENRLILIILCNCVVFYHSSV